MTLNDMSQPNPFLHDHAWQALIEFTLPRESNSAYVAADRVVEAMQRLNWPAALLEQLKFTLAGATGYVMARADYYGSETPLIIRVLIPKDDLVIIRCPDTNILRRQNWAEGVRWVVPA